MQTQFVGSKYSCYDSIMKRNFFVPDDDLSGIIHSNLEGVEEIKHILTGWTNIVMEVRAGSGSYFFRFPRNPFWAKMIRKDASFCRFVSGKTSFYTPQMKLKTDIEGRPFSIHKKIEGYSLTDRIYNLSHTAMAAVAHDCAKFVYELSMVSADKAPKRAQYPLKKFLYELDSRHYVEHLTQDHKYLEDSDTEHFVHGDLNIGNILVDENDNMTAVIDFCFAGKGNPNMDISRILSRPVPEVFEQEFVAEYDRLVGGADIGQIQEMRRIWGRIDAGYIGHIKRAHPEITLPPGM